MEMMLLRVIGEDIQLTKQLASDLGCVKADPGQVEQVIMNLVVNARDAMPNGGILTIETSNVQLGDEYKAVHPLVTPGPYVMFVVSDTGLGMDAETRERIFEPFYTTKSEGKGTGLGLSTVYGIVKQSGGFIWVYSELGRGTMFKIYLPFEASAPDERSETSAWVDDFVGSGTVMVVEDEPAIRHLADRILSHYGFNVITVSCAEEALPSADSVKPDLVLTDVVMPGMNGPEMARELKARYPDLKVLFMSGYSEHQAILNGFKEIADIFIAKPFTREALIQKIRELLESPGLGRETNTTSKQSNHPMSACLRLVMSLRKAKTLRLSTGRLCSLTSTSNSVPFLRRCRLSNRSSPLKMTFCICMDVSAAVSIASKVIDVHAE